MDNLEDYETLDPKNWDEMRALAHRMVDDAITYIEMVEERPVWQPVPEEDLTAFFPTVTLADSDKEKPFLSSKRRQRRLIQRLTAEGYFIVQKAT